MKDIPESSLSILGQEVSLGQVDMALKELWGRDEARTRASMMNFAIYSEDAASLEHNTRLLEEVTREHACRGLLVLALPQKTPPRARAWITAHCQLHEGQKSVCSEQVSFVLEGGSADQLRNIVFAHLDSDLQLAFWWQGNLTASFDERLYSVIDVLFVDSSKWQDPVRDLARIQEARRQDAAQFRAYDLSWLRSHLFRTALASCFQDAPALAELPKVEGIEIVHSSGHRPAGLLLAAWIGVRLKCTLETSSGLSLVTPEGRAMHVRLRDGGPGEALRSIELTSSNARFRAARDCGETYICTKVQIGEHVHEEMLPADLVSDAALIAEQLSRLGGQSLYAKIVPMFQAMLGAK